MNNELQQKRLLFAVKRAETGLEIKPENLIVKARQNSGRKCKNAREEFSYLRNNVIVNVNGVLLEENVQITSKLLTKSMQRVIAENSKAEENTLSA